MIKNSLLFSHRAFQCNFFFRKCHLTEFHRAIKGTIRYCMLVSGGIPKLVQQPLFSTEYWCLWGGVGGQNSFDLFRHLCLSYPRLVRFSLHMPPPSAPSPITNAPFLLFIFLIGYICPPICHENNTVTQPSFSAVPWSHWRWCYNRPGFLYFI